MKRLLHGPTIWMQAVKAIIPFSGLHCITPYSGATRRSRLKENVWSGKLQRSGMSCHLRFGTLQDITTFIRSPYRRERII